MEEVAPETAFVVMYRGRTIRDSTIVALSAEREIVARFEDMLPPDYRAPRPDLRLVHAPDHDGAA
jgi:hypothetical protein